MAQRKRVLNRKSAIYKPSNLFSAGNTIGANFGACAPTSYLITFAAYHQRSVTCHAAEENKLLRSLDDCYQPVRVQSRDTESVDSCSAAWKLDTTSTRMPCSA